MTKKLVIIAGIIGLAAAAAAAVAFFLTRNKSIAGYRAVFMSSGESKWQKKKR